MWIRFLKLCARRPLLALFLAIVTISGIVATPFVLSRTSAAEDAANNPRELIGRIWLDRYPEKARDEVDLFIFFGSGFGIYEHGSRYRATMEFFEFERQRDKLEINFFQDKKRARTTFKINKCADDPSFDLCLDLATSPRGPARYYSWGGRDEDSAKIPWASAWKRGAEERARAARDEE